MIEHLQKLPAETVERFLEIREAEPLGIPKQLADYILQINEATNIRKKCSSVQKCAEQLQRIYPKLSICTCKSRIYDSIKLLSYTTNITAEEWNNYFAEQMEKMAEVNIVAHDFKEWRRCKENERKWRILASENVIDPDRIKFKPQLVSADMELDRMGIKKEGLLSAWNQAIAIIEKEDINDTEKQRLFKEVKTELNITDVDYETVES